MYTRPQQQSKAHNEAMPKPASRTPSMPSAGLPNSALLSLLEYADIATSQPNKTGLPDALKARFERLTGMPLDDVRVHRNSDKPAELGALAYAQGNEIHLGPGQEEHLEHELGHVVQQKQGLVYHNKYDGGIPINDNPALENRAENISPEPPSALHTEAIPQVVQCTKGAVNKQHGFRGQRRIARVTQKEIRKKARLSAKILREIGLKTGTPYGGARNRIIVLRGTHPTSEPIPAGSRNRLKALHSQQAIRVPRSYADTPVKQRMRWLSTYLRLNCRTETEVQCYYDSSRNAILVAANSHSDLDKLRAFQNMGLGTIAEEAKSFANTADATARDKRHIAKMGMRGFQLKNGLDLSGAAITVVTRETGIDGLHAERRIQKTLADSAGCTVDETFLNPLYLGGQRRPCTVCGAVAFPRDACEHVHPGPLWPSAAAAAELTHAQMARTVDAIQGETNMSYITQMSDDSLSTAYDTESDSDVESHPPSASPIKGRRRHRRRRPRHVPECFDDDTEVFEPPSEEEMI